MCVCVGYLIGIRSSTVKNFKAIQLLESCQMLLWKDTKDKQIHRQIHGRIHRDSMYSCGNGKEDIKKIDEYLSNSGSYTIGVSGQAYELIELAGKEIKKGEVK